MTLSQTVMIAVLFLFTVGFARELRVFTVDRMPLPDARGRFLATFYGG